MLCFNTVFAMIGEKEHALNNTEQTQEEMIEQKVIYLSQKKLPKNIYKNEIIKLVFKAIITDNFVNIKTQLHNHYGFLVLSKNTSWNMVSANKYELVVYGKITQDVFKIPNISVTATLSNARIATETLTSKPYKSYSIAENEKYIGLITSELNVTNHSTQKFNDTQNIVAMEMKGLTTNFKDINISFAYQQGFDKIEVDYPYSTIFYYAVIDNNIEKLSFLTFNPETGNFDKHVIHLDLSNVEQKISTQIDLNPNKKKIPFLKILIIGSIIIINLLLIYKFRHILLLASLVVVLIASSFVLLKQEEVIILSDSEIYLLPIKNSTLFYKTDTDTKATKLHENAQYIKVILPDESIGWVKKENVR